MGEAAAPGASTQMSGALSPAASPQPPRFAAAVAAGLEFRAATDQDLPFLRELYGDTRAAELAPVPWNEAEKAAFIVMQFSAQHAHYTRHYPAAQRLIIQRAGVPIGRLYVDRWEREHRIVDIALVSAQCGKGFGSAVLRDLLGEGGAANKCVTVHVEKHNPAMRLYVRLGFVSVEDKGVYDLMRWTPRAQVNTAS
jgi:ribosomal protein S18 acetylase RimI-like enzyme